MKTRTRAWLTLAVSIGTAAVLGSAACSGGGGGGGSPSPSATTVNFCQVVWASAGSTQGHFDIYVVDAPLADWTTGTHSFDLTVNSQVAALFYDEFDKTTNPVSYLSRAISTNGSYSVIAAGGTTSGNMVTLTDSSGQLFYAVSGNNVIGALVGSDGTGSFQGAWSNPATPDSPTPGDPGSLVNFTFQGTPETLGTTISYALCYDSTPFAPMRVQDRVDSVLQAHFPASE